MAGFFDNVALFCGSKDLIYALQEGNTTAFCTITGKTTAYDCFKIWR